MHDVLRSKLQSPFQKFHTNFINFEKPQNFSKNPKKLGQMHEKERIRTVTKWRKPLSRPKNPWGWSLEWGREVLGGEKSEEIEQNEFHITLTLYIGAL